MMKDVCSSDLCHREWAILAHPVTISLIPGCIIGIDVATIGRISTLGMLRNRSQERTLPKNCMLFPNRYIF